MFVLFGELYFDDFVDLWELVKRLVFKEVVDTCLVVGELFYVLGKSDFLEPSLVQGGVCIEKHQKVEFLNTKLQRQSLGPDNLSDANIFQTLYTYIMRHRVTFLRIQTTLFKCIIRDIITLFVYFGVAVCTFIKSQD